MLVFHSGVYISSSQKVAACSASGGWDEGLLVAGLEIEEPSMGCAPLLSLHKVSLHKKVEPATHFWDAETSEAAALPLHCYFWPSSASSGTLLKHKNVHKGQNSFFSPHTEAVFIAGWNQFALVRGLLLKKPEQSPFVLTDNKGSLQWFKKKEKLNLNSYRDIRRQIKLPLLVNIFPKSLGLDFVLLNWQAYRESHLNEYSVLFILNFCLFWWNTFPLMYGNTLNITVCGNNVVCQADFCNHVLSCLVLFPFSCWAEIVATYILMYLGLHLTSRAKHWQHKYHLSCPMHASFCHICKTVSPPALNLWAHGLKVYK